MSVAKVNPQQGEVVLPAISNAFSVPPIQRSYNEGRAHEIYACQTDPKTVAEQDVLTLEIPPCSAQQVYDLTQSHIEMTYYWEYAQGTNVSSNQDATNPIAKAPSASSISQSVLGEKTDAFTAGAFGTSQDLNYSTLGKEVESTLVGDKHILPKHQQRPGETLRDHFMRCVADNTEEGVNTPDSQAGGRRRLPPRSAQVLKEQEPRRGHLHRHYCYLTVTAYQPHD